MKYYLDNAATTRVYDEVVKEMERYLTDNFGNPGSPHDLGDKAINAINDSRVKLARVINAKPSEIIFTSGATESNNLAILGLAKSSDKKTIIISSIEHPSVIEPCEYLESQGYKIIKIHVDKEGVIKMDELEKAINANLKDLLLVSVMNVNNIIGSIQPIEDIGNLCKNKGVLFHTDAVQSFGKMGIDVKKMNIDLLSASGHKIGSSKGIGLLYVREGVKISPIILGGGQERGLRSGTENVPAIVGFAKAVEIQKKIDKEQIKKIRDKLIVELERIGGKINGSINNRIYNNVHVSFKTNADNLVQFLSEKGIYVSTGSACESKKKKEDHVLIAIGLTKAEREGSIRITINEDITERGVYNIVKEIEKGIKINIIDDDKKL